MAAKSSTHMIQPPLFTQKRPQVIAWTDGGCKPNPGLGAWGYIFKVGGGDSIFSSGINPSATNNEMELEAIWHLVQEIKRGSAITIYSDSILAIQWLRGEWECKVSERCRQLLKYIDDEIWISGHKITYAHVTRHSGDRMNEACGQLVSRTIEKYSQGDKDDKNIS